MVNKAGVVCLVMVSTRGRCRPIYSVFGALLVGFQDESRRDKWRTWTDFKVSDFWLSPQYRYLQTQVKVWFGGHYLKVILVRVYLVFSLSETHPCALMYCCNSSKKDLSWRIMEDLSSPRSNRQSFFFVIHRFDQVSTPVLSLPGKYLGRNTFSTCYYYYEVEYNGVLQTIIQKNTKIPHKAKRFFTTHEDNQTKMEIKVCRYLISPM